jgi:GH24 family phage-related lysozyme (muramidase)
LGNYTAGQGQTLKDITAGNAAANQAVAQAGQTDASNLWGLLGAGVKAAGAGFGGGARPA